VNSSSKKLSSFLICCCVHQSPPLPGDSPIVVATASGRSAEVPLVGEFEFEFQIFDRFKILYLKKIFSNVRYFRISVL
jgi:hypothetical protein